MGFTLFIHLKVFEEVYYVWPTKTHKCETTANFKAWSVQEMSGATEKEIEEEIRRRTNNQAAWANWGGYRTTSGWPCWDKTPHVFIPKYTTGFGYTINCWALCCCCYCDTAVSEDPNEVRKGMAMDRTVEPAAIVKA